MNASIEVAGRLHHADCLAAATAIKVSGNMPCGYEAARRVM